MGTPEMGFRGQLLRRHQTEAFCITETAFRGGATLATHEHENAYISFLLAGAYLEKVGSVEHFCSLGTVIWHPAGETHSNRFLVLGGHLLNLEFRGVWFRGIRHEMKLPIDRRSFRGGLPYTFGLRLFRALHRNTEDAEELVIDLLTLFSSGPESARPGWLNRALELLDVKFDHHLTLSAVGAEVGVHPVHVARSFRRFLGCTFGEYLAKVRMRQAFDLLQDPETSIVNVSIACGFSDHSHLCRAFRQSTGLTPSAYRRLVVATRKGKQ